MLTIKEIAAKLTKAGYTEGTAGRWSKPAKTANRWIVILVINTSAVAFMEDQYGRVTMDMEPIDWEKF